MAMKKFGTKPKASAASDMEAEADALGRILGQRKSFKSAMESTPTAGFRSNLPARVGDTGARTNLPARVGDTGTRTNLTARVGDTGTKSNMPAKVGDTGTKSNMPALRPAVTPGQKSSMQTAPKVAAPQAPKKSAQATAGAKKAALKSYGKNR